MTDGYRVALNDCTSEFTEKKSRFISNLCCAQTEQGAKTFIDSVRAKYPDATHNCVAYRLREPRIERFSDDGEPAGTAGMPMLEVMKKEDIYNVCVVVTRYFGGILLGGGGLIRAYSKGASDALAKSGRAIRLKSVSLELEFGYAGYDKLEKYLENVTHNRLFCNFNENVSLGISVIDKDCDNIMAQITDLLCGAVLFRKISSGFDSFK